MTQARYQARLRHRPSGRRHRRRRRSLPARFQSPQRSRHRLIAAGAGDIGPCIARIPVAAQHAAGPQAHQQQIKQIAAGQRQPIAQPHAVHTGMQQAQTDQGHGSQTQAAGQSGMQTQPVAFLQASPHVLVAAQLHLVQEAERRRLWRLMGREVRAFGRLTACRWSRSRLRRARWRRQSHPPD
jgi:hypothetical protein